ncbi:hypothetical protein EK0264_01615 [Epidermidibacterium keratini]|uniref:Uncharacterized protein n=1 Tax=Epidermidibacterium keratini TaxID=1891644 RepID=A0A7L4YJU3_9ACTN|nr:hypothetical protein [Epidermidibacterium keratini]QHB99113.1 hypothetical protein EK0264_01615 [Epidermidibacterium keratini]
MAVIQSFWTAFLSISPNVPDSVLPIFAALCLATAMFAIAGSAILLSGAGGLWWLRLGCLAALVAIWLAAISATTIADDPADAAVTYGVQAVLASIIPVAALVCSLSRSLAQWLAAKAAAEAVERAAWQNVSLPPR